jgi:hypothetical protein
MPTAFIAASQDALHGAPDALFGKTGADAVEAAPAVTAQLSGLRDTTLELARDEPERQALADRLERYHSVALDDIGRHVAEQRRVAARQTIADRQALNLRAAGLRHNEDVLPGLAGAHAQAAQALARLDGTPEAPAMQAARSAVWRSAIDQRLADGEGARALSLFEQAKGTLVPADQRALEVPLQAARTDAAADAWIARETDRDGEPLVMRLQSDDGLSPAEKATALAKIEARDSAQESARVATVKASTTGSGQPPARSRPNPPPIDRARWPPSQTPTTMPVKPTRPTAHGAWRCRKASCCLSRAAAKPIDDIAGRIAQARTIAAYRGIPVAPFTANELATLRHKLADGTPQERDVLLTQLGTLPEDMKEAIALAGEQLAKLTPPHMLQPPPEQPLAPLKPPPAPCPPFFPCPPQADPPRPGNEIA